VYHDADAIAVDIPIGLPVRKVRQADIEARHFLGSRWRSVFRQRLVVGPLTRHEPNVGEEAHDPPSRSSFSLPRLAPTADLSLEVASPPTSLRTPDG
jgi:hypothetical protein